MPPPKRVEEITTSAHQLRQALAALLVFHLERPERCPNCGVRLPRHVAGCHLAELLRRASR